MGPTRIYPWRKTHRSPARSIAPGTFFVAQPWADCITNMPGFNLRQAHVGQPKGENRIGAEIVGETDDRDQRAKCDDAELEAEANGFGRQIPAAVPSADVKRIAAQ
jgi:hypothetical protein